MDMESKKKKQRKLQIPDDLIFNILLRLSTKSLMRFKCVCKLWLSFVSQSKCDDHNLILSSWFSIHSVELEASSHIIKASQLDFPITSPNHTNLIGSCNGLLCVSIKGEGFVLWNPWTGTYKRVPVLFSPLDDLCDRIGFGYDHSTDDYKIVRFVYNNMPGISFEIFSLKADSWEKQSFPRRIVFSFVEPHGIGTFVNGALYWRIIYLRYFGSGTICPSNVILRLCLVNNKISVILPPDDIGTKPEFDLGVFGGRLCMVHYHDGGLIDMWAREDLGKKQNWIKLMSIPLLEELPSDKHYLAPVCFIRNQVLMNVRKMFRTGSNKRRMEKQFMLYIPEENTFRKFDIQDIDRFYEVTTCTPSIISPIRIDS